MKGGQGCPAEPGIVRNIDEKFSAVADGLPDVPGIENFETDGQTHPECRRGDERRCDSRYESRRGPVEVSEQVVPEGGCFGVGKQNLFVVPSCTTFLRDHEGRVVDALVDPAKPSGDKQAVRSEPAKDPAKEIVPNLL